MANEPTSRQQIAPATEAVASRTPWPLYISLCGMMFLQYFVQGCYLPVVPLYLEHTLGFSKSLVGTVLSALAVGPLVTWIIAGQLVDRKFATQHVLAASHLLSGLTMLWLFAQRSFWPVLLLASLYSVLYVPTLMLTNAMAFHHLANREREFPVVRMWGTIGFIVPAWLIEMVLLRNLEGSALDQARGIILVAAGVAGLVMAAYCLFLPPTPPLKRDSAEFAPAVALGLLRQRRILVLVGVTLLIAIAHKYHFSLCPDFLKTILRSGGVMSAWEQRIMSLGQIAEIAVMAGLGAMVVRWGFKRTMLLGAAAYVARCLIFAGAYNLQDAFAWKLAIVCAGQMLHGLCFGCFMAAAFMYLDRTTAEDIRGSVQNMYGTFVIGSGFFAGGMISGWVADSFRTADGFDWTGIWLAAAALAGVATIAFAIWFPRQDDVRGESAA